MSGDPEGPGGAGGDDSSTEGGSPGAAGNSGAAGESAKWPDEPCPGVEIGTDCSGMCGPRPAICDSKCPIEVPLTLNTGGVVFARLPSHPVAECSCGSKSALYAMSFSFKPTATYAFFRVCVPEPWRVYDRLVTACTNDVQPEHCVYFNLSDRWFTVYTTDPDAPAINLIAEKIPPE